MITYPEDIKVMAIQRFAYDIKPDILLGMNLGYELLVANIAVRWEVRKVDGVLQPTEGRF